MDIQTLTQQQQNDFLASFFPSSDAQHEDSYHNNMRSQGGRSNGSPASSSSSGALHDGHGGSTLMDSSSANLRSTNNSTSNTGHIRSGHDSGASTIFPPSSPIQPQSPNSQLTMQLLGNLMQMQGSLDNNFAHQNTTTYSNPHSGGPSTYGQGFGGVSSQHGRGGNLPVSGANPAYTNTAILEQQLKLQQLQQLQQLQNQIFQQQIALISSQSPPIAPTSPNTFAQPSQSDCHSNAATSPNFTGLATPGPSSELRPQQPHIDFDHFSQPLPSPMPSQNAHSQSFSHHSNDFLHRGASSAPEHIAFHIRTGPTPSPHFSGGSRREFDLDISPLNSPWIGPQHGGGSGHTGEREHSHDQSSHRLPEQRLPSNKRGAPSNGDEPSHSRKKHSSALPSVTEDVTQAGASGGMLTNPSSSGRRSYHKGSKSTTSTPLLRSSRSRSKSGAGNAFATSPLTTSSGSSGHNVDVHGAYAGQGGSGANSTHSLPSIPIDTPSPVDLSMPPPPAPATVSNDPNIQSEDDGRGGFAFGDGGGSGASSSNPGPQLTPLTPGVIMKLGPFGQGTGSTTPTLTSMPASATATATAVPAPSLKSTAKSKAKSESGGKKAAAAGGLKPILPVGGVHASPAGPSGSMDPPSGPPKKVSHKDAEQKRRDSQKTAYDELRRLLPPITFEDDQDEMGGDGHAVMSKKKDEVIPVRGPLPPGALPPRGPPKAGGEGPNKGVSKLQLLICGNQYIRTLKGRVERRDGEIANLRREVARLRRKTGVLEGKLERVKGMGLDEVGMEVDGFDLDEDEEEVEIDLERDLDAVEGMGVHVGLPGMYDDEGDE